MPTPGEAKKAGRSVHLRTDWEQIKVGLMCGLVSQKFQDPKLKQMLLDTGDQELIEGNYWFDDFWGVHNGKGKNQLGKILMLVRDSTKTELTLKNLTSQNNA
jgi:predicted NAD-dependent protein-ADP-ribosyltransferase YbiA (DUF1768 family)